MIGKRGRIITFHSSKGGVGKSLLLRNTATLLASLGKSVCIYETVVGGNLNKMMGLFSSAYTPFFFEDQEQMLERIEILTDEYGVSLLPSGNVLSNPYAEQAVDKILNHMVGEFDFVLVDTEPRLTLTNLPCLYHSDSIVLIHDNNESGLIRFYERIEMLIGNRETGEGLGIDRKKISILLNKNKTISVDRIAKEKNILCYKIDYTEEVERHSDSKEVPYVIYDPKDRFTKQLQEIVKGLYSDANFSIEQRWSVFRR